MKLTIYALVVCALLVACSSMAPVPRAETILRNGDSRVGTYVSEPKGFSTSSYWIEGPEGLVLIDTQFLLSAANQLIDWAESATGKKVVLAIVLHPNPDKFNGVGELQKRGIRVITSKQVAHHIPEVHQDRHHWFYKRFQPDYPNVAPVVESFGEGTTELLAAGLPLKLHVVGAGCSAAHVVVEYDGHLFVGDLVANLGHAWLELGLVEEWLKRIDELEALKPTYIHPGRGPSGGAELLARHRAYLHRVKSYVLGAKPWKRRSEAMKESAMKKIQSRLETDYPGYGNAYFIQIGLPAVWDKLASK